MESVGRSLSWSPYSAMLNSGNKIYMCFSIFSLSSCHVLTSAPTISLCPFHMESVSSVSPYCVTLYCRFPRAACEPAARVDWHFWGSWLEAQVSSVWILHHPPRAWGEDWCWRGGLLPARRLCSSAGISERKEINHKLHLVTDRVKQRGYFGCSHLERGWLSVPGGLLHVLFPWWQSECSPTMSFDT